LPRHNSTNSRFFGLFSKGEKALLFQPSAERRVLEKRGERYPQILHGAQRQKCRGLLSDNGSSYIAGELADYIEANKMSHVRGAPCHPQTQGKIERWHQTLKNRILLENYFLPGDLERQIEAFVEHYNHQRYHESLNNVTPADAYFGRAETIIKQREWIKRQTIEYRRLQHCKLAA
jgi:transposase InsO family protein